MKTKKNISIKIRKIKNKNARKSNVGQTSCKLQADSSDVDMIQILKRRAEKAEMRLENTRKKVSEEQKVTKTLKRKLQEETMVRKLKDRRLNYLQTKNRCK